MAKKSSTIGSRLAPGLRERLNKIIDRHGTNDSEILNRLLPSFCDAIEEADAVRWPAVVLMAEKQPMVAEESHKPGQAKAGTSPPKPPDKSKRPRGDGPRVAI
ncbi:MAG TPA: hypothetical protein VHD61_15790 [Lacunisphaera sp.]|nr:hypothetical protein [Lacunisphaera sp.]